MIFKFNYYRSIQFLLILLLIPTTYIGIPLNGGRKGWIYVNSLLRDFYSDWSSFFVNENSILFISINFFILLINILLYSSPILVFTKYNKMGSMYIPTIYLILTIAYFPLMVILLIPYIFIWATLFIYSKYALEKQAF
ncbi:hypothetical protein DU508_18940 [Pedobacter chinensis]|uniref:Uncharacterized protein n=1 Tax=Pedobacter chinensis TaxID=2282421 RepID=A0A369PUG6_9SPHI|nr:hypothetical protein DU508_18940 [Pedobacter chinensis]